MVIMRRRRVKGSRVSVDGARGPASGSGPRVEGRAAPRAGFTILELLLSLLILSLLVTILVVAVNRARSSGGIAAERLSVSAMKLGVEQFQSEFGFLPPLVKDNNVAKYPGYKAPNSDMGPLDDGMPVVFDTGDVDDLEYLRGGLGTGGPGGDSSSEDYRFSEYSIPYYLVGALGEDKDGVLIDGVAGPGFRTPRRDGSFEKSGREFKAYFEPPSRGGGIVTVDQEEGRIEARDNEGIAYRYYRWEPGHPQTGELKVGSTYYYNVPDIVGDPSVDASLRGARFAIVAAGPNGVFGELTEGGYDVWSTKVGTGPEGVIKKRARDDNVVEVGK